MKTFITILLVILSLSVEGQSDFLNVVDSFFVVCNQVRARDYYSYQIDPNINISYIEKNISNNYNYNKVSLHIVPRDTVFFQEMIDHINTKYLPIVNPWIRRAIINIYIQMINTSSLDTETKQKLVEICFQNSEITDVFSNLKNIPVNYLNNNSKQRMKYILTDGNKSAIEDTLEAMESCYLDKMNTKRKDIEIKANEKNMTVEEYSDSINNICLKDYIKFYSLHNSYIIIPLYLLYLVGDNNLVEFCPIMDTMIKNKNRRIDNYIAYIVLGKLKYKNYDSIAADMIVKEILESPHKPYRDFSVIQYINTQEAYFIYSSLLLCMEKILCCGVHDDITETRETGYYVMAQLSGKIKNFPYQFNFTGDYFEDCYCDITKKYTIYDLKYAYNWMKKNKGKYIIEKNEIDY